MYMRITRRKFGKLAVASLPVAGMALSHPAMLFAADKPKPNSMINGVQIGCITAYSYRSMAQTDAMSCLSYLLTDGVSATEMENTQETYAGSPQRPAAGRPTGAAARGDGGVASLASRTGGGGAARTATPEQIAEREKFAEQLTAWRLSAPMEKYTELKNKYAEAGVSIFGFKIGLTMQMPDGVYDYAFNAAKLCGANQLTMEMPTDPALTERVGQFASKHKMMVGYHAHAQATPTIWDQAMSQSEYNGINLDLGHYTQGGNHDQLDFIRKNHARITSMHLKDMTYPENGGKNTPWGHGDTPLKAALKLVQKEGYKFPCTIELEYPIPDDSDAVKEVAKCMQFCRESLA
jgi:sugar phosphate isomerase/epimerase